MKVPHLEARVQSVENAVQGYVDMIGNETLGKSRLPEPKGGRSGSHSSSQRGGGEQCDEEDSHRARR